MFDRVLVANRGEIAARIASTLRAMSIESVAVYADDDASQPHTRLADHAIALGEGPPLETYLDAEGLVQAAQAAGADAVHPGYGFLSEDPAFARRVQDAGLTWVGPPPKALELLGDKARALSLAQELGLPTTPGSDGPVETASQALDAVEAAGVPSVIKAVHGGGGMGMVKVESLDEVDEAFEAARSQAENAFGSPEVLVERWWEAPRHVEVQVAFPKDGEGVHLFERECSLQRRHQKLIEEAPAPNLDPAARDELTEQAILLCQAAGVEALATVEFLLTAEGPVFNEVNPRLQVEHPVTELVTGTDLVEWQVRLAAGEPVPTPQEGIGLNGWAIEARVNAEDPLDGFHPAPGPITHVHVPQGEGVRVDHALVPGGTVSPRYDSLVAKVIAHGATREAAIERSREALARLRVGGRPTTAGFLYELLDHPRVVEGDMDTNLVDEEAITSYRDLVHGAMALLVTETGVGSEGSIVLDGHEAPWTRGEEGVSVEGHPAEPAGEMPTRDRVRMNGRVLEGQARPAIATQAGPGSGGKRLVESPLAGTVDAILVEEGDEVEEGTEVIVVEAMKMKNRVGARAPGRIAEILAEPGESVAKGAPLIRIEDLDT